MPNGSAGLTPAEVAWLLRSVGSDASLIACERLAGSTSADLFRCVVGVDAVPRALVLRRYTVDQEMAANEAWALQRASALPIGTPALIAVRERSDGEDALLLMEALPGRVVLDPDDRDAWLAQLAGALWAVHQVAADDAPHPYFPYYQPQQPELPAWTGHRDAWRQAIATALGPAPQKPEVFLHRDFHPCNVLFEGQRLSGVVDWVNACRGMAGVDIAHCRWNLALLHGVETADRFLALYAGLAGPHWEYEPYFDLVELCEKLPGPPDVYPGWPVFGMRGLTDRLMLERTEALLTSALARC